MNRFNVLIVMADGQTLRIRQCFLEFSGEFVDSHQETSNSITTKMRRFIQVSSAFLPQATTI
jgi:hypothetical protein